MVVVRRSGVALNSKKRAATRRSGRLEVLEAKGGAIVTVSYESKYTSHLCKTGSGRLVLEKLRGR